MQAMADDGTAPLDPAALVRRFYACRRDGDPEQLRPLLTEDVIWREPEVEGHMGELRGSDAVIDMIRRALSTTDSSFALKVSATMATANACAAVIRWRAEKGGQPIDGRELAVFRFEGDRIGEACFFPEWIADDHAFWA